MKTLRLIGLVLVAFLWVESASAAPRVLTQTIPAADLQQVAIQAGVGDVTVLTGSDDSVGVEVILKPRRGGLFSSMRQAEREVQEATLSVERDGGKVSLEVRSASEEHRFEESWTVTMPARLALKLEAGVGDVEVRGLTGGVELEAGVGDVLVEAGGGNLHLEVGVGDLTLRAPADAYGSVACSTGVGDLRLKVLGKPVESSGFVGTSASWSGNGPHRVDVELGVGDATVTLD